MSGINSYTDGGMLFFSVTVGRRRIRGFKTANGALARGIEEACINDPRTIQLIRGKSFERQVGIVFGADVVEKYCKGDGK